MSEATPVKRRIDSRTMDSSETGNSSLLIRKGQAEAKTANSTAAESLANKHLPGAGPCRSSDRPDNKEANQASDPICADGCRRQFSGSDPRSDAKPQRCGGLATVRVPNGRCDGKSGNVSHDSVITGETGRQCGTMTHYHGDRAQDKLPETAVETTADGNHRVGPPDSAKVGPEKPSLSESLADLSPNVCDSMNQNDVQKRKIRSDAARHCSKSMTLGLPEIRTSVAADQDLRTKAHSDGSAKSSPMSLGSLSPTSWSVASASPLESPQRPRSLGCSLSTRSLEALIGGSGRTTSLKLARDPHQPHSGSITDIHAQASTADDVEETDGFDLTPVQRPRARTWSENRAWQRMRKARVKVMTRPPTPPPGDADRFLLDKKLHSTVSKEKLKIPDRELPKLPETIM